MRYELSRSKSSPNLRLASFTMARNEAPFAGPFCDQLNEFFDYPLVFDHDSADSTLADLQSALPGENVFQLRSAGYPQSELASLVASLVFENTDTDYLFFLDCDEYLPFDSKIELMDCLLRQPSEGTLYLKWRNLAPSGMEGGDIFSQRFHQASHLSPYKKVVASKRHFKIDPDATVSQGYHDLVSPSRDPYVELSSKGLYHIPVSSRGKFSSKIIDSSNRILADKELVAKKLGVHWIELLRLVQSGELSDATLIDLALSYPTQSSAGIYRMPLSFTFPYIRSSYRETSMTSAKLDRQASPESSRGFALSNWSGQPLFDSLTADKRILGRHFARLRPLLGGRNQNRTRTRAPSPTHGEPLSMKSNFAGDLNYSDLVGPLFSLPQRMPATAWYGHIPFLFVLMRMMKPRRFAELGVHLGASFITACTASKSYGLDTELIGIDTWEGDPHAGYYSGQQIYSDLHSYLRAHFTGHKLIRKTFREALDDIADGTVDLLHIDGLHTYEAVKEDYLTWLPKMRQDGVIMFHDTNVFDREFGVHQLWSEIATTQNSLNFPHSFGLGVLLLSPEAPRLAPLQPLLADPCLRDLYYRLAADVGETLPFRAGFAQSLSEGHVRSQSTSVRRSAAELLVAIKVSAHHRLAQTPFRRLLAKI
jgi:hypothetical protein